MNNNLINDLEKNLKNFLKGPLKDSITELRNLDSILTEISKTSDLTSEQLKDLGDSAFKSAGKYGKAASDYLAGVQKMYQSGFNNAAQMSELSMLAQAAGNMNSSIANEYLIASDAAYGLKGNIQALNGILDGQNYITDNAAVSMNDMALATSNSASAAAKYGVQINELSALIATVISKTHASGNEAGNALKELFDALQDTGNVSVREALDSVNISMIKTVNGSKELKTPIQLLRELSSAFTSLNENDTRRISILSDIGGSDNSSTLSAILNGWSSYEQMLNLYSDGMGSAARDAEITANSWEGALTRLSDTWTDTIGNIADADMITSGINALNTLLSVVNDLSSAIGPLGTLGIIGGGLLGTKNVGRTKMFVLI